MEKQLEAPGLADSWVTLSLTDMEESEENYINTSYNGDMERLLFEAQKEGSTPSRSKNSSKSSSVISTPPKQVNKENRSNRDSSCNDVLKTPHDSMELTQIEEIVPKLVEVKTERSDSDWVWDWSSQPTVTAAKEFQFCHPKPKGTPLSLRKTNLMKHGIFSREFLQYFIPSLIVTNLLAFGVGVYVGRRMANVAKNT